MYLIYYTRTELPPWTIHDLFDELSTYFVNNYDTKIITQRGGHVYVDRFDYHIGDCELIIYDDKKDILEVISYSETKTKLLDVLKIRNNVNDNLIVLHKWGYELQNLDGYQFKITKTTFYPFHPKINYRFFYNARQHYKFENLIDKMFFRTTTGRGDETKLSECGLINELFHPTNIIEYLELAIQYKMGLSIAAGNYEICHRDFDCMAIGLPLIRLELLNSYNPEIIPNYHYISVPRDGLGKDGYLDHKGGIEYIEAYRNRFIQVKDDEEFLSFISNNAYQYYSKYCSPENKLKNILNLLTIITK